jgi:hypothetical protein
VLTIFYAGHSFCLYFILVLPFRVAVVETFFAAIVKRRHTYDMCTAWVRCAL